MASELNAIKKHFDITMSRRTRRAKLVPQKPDQNLEISNPQTSEGGGMYRKNLNQLIKSDHNELGAKNSLIQHFTEEKEEEKQLQLVTTKQKQNGGTIKGMVGRYMKVLSNVIKAKNEPRLAHRKRPLLHGSYRKIA